MLQETRGLTIAFAIFGTWCMEIIHIKKALTLVTYRYSLASLIYTSMFINDDRVFEFDTVNFSRKNVNFLFVTFATLVRATRP